MTRPCAPTPPSGDTSARQRQQPRTADAVGEVRRHLVHVLTCIDRLAEEAIAALGAARSHLRQARRVVEELRDVVHSALAVIEDAEVDAAQARTAERGALYLESTVEHLGRLRTRCDVISELSDELAGQLSLAAGAVADADELSALIRREPQLAGAAGRIKERTAALQALIDLARHITDLITGPADTALVASRETTTARPLEPQDVDRGVRSTARELDRAEEDALLLETVVGRADATSQLVGCVNTRSGR